MFCSKGRSRGKTETIKLANRCLCINCVAKRADQFRKERSSDTPLLRHQVKGKEKYRERKAVAVFYRKEWTNEGTGWLLHSELGQTYSVVYSGAAEAVEASACRVQKSCHYENIYIKWKEATLGWLSGQTSIVHDIRQIVLKGKWKWTYRDRDESVGGRLRKERFVSDC